MGPTNSLVNTAAEKVLREELPAENTIRAFKAAIILGCDGIEFDLYLTQDEIPVVIHDDELWRHEYNLERNLVEFETSADFEIKNKRMEFRVHKMTLKELQQLRVGPKPGDRVPTFTEVLAICSKANKIRAEIGLEPLKLNVELKTPRLIPGDKYTERDDLAAKKTAARRLLVEKTVQCIFDFQRDLDLENYYFCTYDDEIASLIKNQSKVTGVRFKVSIARTTEWLFGTENVASLHLAKYKTGRRERWDKLGTHAYDLFFSDIYDDLLNAAKAQGTPIHTCPSEHRDYNNPPMFGLILKTIAASTPEFFLKCDDVAQFRECLLYNSRLPFAYTGTTSPFAKQAAAFYHQNHHLSMAAIEARIKSNIQSN